MKTGKLFFVARHCGVIAGQIVASSNTTDEQAKAAMLKSLRSCPGVFGVEGFTPFEAELKLQHATVARYELRGSS